MTQSVRLFHDGQPPIVQMSGRHFPGVVIQGDTLSTWYSTLKTLADNYDEGAQEELLGQVGAYLNSYVAVRQSQGHPLPFTWPLD